MRRIAVLVILSLALTTTLSCFQDESDSKPPAVVSPAMAGPAADCEYPVLTFKLADESLVELDINGLPVKWFWGAKLLCQSCNNPANWQLVLRRGVSFDDIFVAAGIDMPDSTPVNIIGRDGWDPWRTVLACDPAKLMTFGYLRDFAYVYVGSPGFKDPAYPGVDPKDPLYPAMEGRSLCMDYNHDSILGAQAAASAGGMEIESEGCFGQFRYKMLEKVSDEARGIVEIDPQP